ncbi:hypothetical protein MXB_1431, partial [Myxobolus squamalis]
MYCESDNNYFQNLSSTKNLMDVVSFRLSAFRVMNTFKNVPGLLTKVISSASKAVVGSDGPTLMAAKNILVGIKRNYGDEVVREIVSTIIRPLLVKLAQFQQFNLNAAEQMRCLVEAFPDMFNEKLCDQFISTLRESLSDFMIRVNKSDPTLKPISYYIHEQLNLWSTLIDIFRLMPNATHKFIHPLIMGINELKNSFGIRVFDPIFLSLLHFLNRYPSESAEYFLKAFKDESVSLIFMFNSGELNFELLDVSNVLIGLKIIWIIQKRHVEFLSVFPLIQTTIRKIWRHIFNKIDIHREKVCRLICKSTFSHLLYQSNPSNLNASMDNLLFLEFINSASLPYLSNWLNVEVYPRIIKSLSFQQIIIFLTEAVNFFHSSNIKSNQCLHLVLFLCCLFEEKLDKHNLKEIQENSVILLQLYERLIMVKPFRHGSNVRGALLNLSCIFIENIPELFNDNLKKTISPRLNLVLEYVQPGLKFEQFFDPYSRCVSFLFITLIIEKYQISENLAESTFLSLLRTYQYEFKSVIKKALRYVFLIFERRTNGAFIIGQLTKKVLIEDSNTALATFHLLAIIIENHDVYVKSLDILYLPIINSLVRLNISLLPSADDKPIFFDTCMMLLEWEIGRTSIEKDIQNSELQVHRAASIIKFAVENNVFSHVDLNFNFFDYRSRSGIQISSQGISSQQTPSNSNFNDRSGSPQFDSSVLCSIDLLAFLIKNLVDSQVVEYIVQYFSEDLSKLILCTTTSGEIKNEVQIVAFSLMQISNAFIQNFYTDITAFSERYLISLVTFLYKY